MCCVNRCWLQGGTQRSLEITVHFFFFLIDIFFMNCDKCSHQTLFFSETSDSFYKGKNPSVFNILKKKENIMIKWTVQWCPEQMNKNEKNNKQAEDQSEQMSLKYIYKKMGVFPFKLKRSWVNFPQLIFPSILCSSEVLPGKSVLPTAPFCSVGSQRRQRHRQTPYYCVFRVRFFLFMCVYFSVGGCVCICVWVCA